MGEHCDYCGHTAAYLFVRNNDPDKVETAACGSHLRRAWDYYLDPGQKATFTVTRLMKE